MTVEIIQKEQNVMLGDFTARFLVEKDGVKRNAIITLGNIESVIPGAKPPRVSRAD
jgi:hypothetical protein